MEGSLGFEGDGGTRTQGLDIPEADAASSERSIGFSAAYATPQSGLGIMPSTPPGTETPTSFHTADPPENDYQQEINSEIIGSLSSMPTIDVSRPAFYSDGRPRPVHHDPDEDSHDSFEDGYTTAAQIPASHHFTDPDQPKLLLAEDPVPPLSEKQPLQDGLAHLPQDGRHEELHSNRSSRRRKGHSQAHHGEDTPLLAEENQDRSRARQQEDSGCCQIL